MCEKREGGAGESTENSLLAFLMFSKQVVYYCLHLSTEQTLTGTISVAAKRQTKGNFAKSPFPNKSRSQLNDATTIIKQDTPPDDYHQDYVSVLLSYVATVATINVK